jgi:hypothetical protein
MYVLLIVLSKVKQRFAAYSHCIKYVCIALIKSAIDLKRNRTALAL